MKLKDMGLSLKEYQEFILKNKNDARFFEKNVIVIGNGINCPELKKRNIVIDMDFIKNWVQKNNELLKNHNKYFHNLKKVNYWVRRMEKYSLKKYVDFEEFMFDFDKALYNNFSEKPFNLLSSPKRAININEYNKLANIIKCAIYEVTQKIQYSKKVIEYLKTFDCILTLNYDNNLDFLDNVYHLHGSFSDFETNMKEKYIELKDNKKIINEEFVDIKTIHSKLKPFLTTPTFTSITGKTSSAYLQKIFSGDNDFFNPFNILASCKNVTYLGVSPKNDFHLFPYDKNLNYIYYCEADLHDAQNMKKHMKENIINSNMFLSENIKNKEFKIRFKDYRDIL